MHKNLVAGIILGTFVLWIAADIWLGPNGGPTESQLLAHWGRVSAFFPFLIGFLMGHWFYGRRNVNYSAWGYGLGLWVLLGLWDCYWWGFSTHEVLYPWFRWSGIWVTAGIPAGSYLWGQRNPDSPVT